MTERVSRQKEKEKEKKRKCTDDHWCFRMSI